MRSLKFYLRRAWKADQIGSEPGYESTRKYEPERQSCRQPQEMGGLPQRQREERKKRVFRIEWRFVVKPGCEEQFERIYGPEGEWARLFRQGGGYIRTELQREEEVRTYRTLDVWRSRNEYEKFREEHGADYQSLDDHCSGLTESEMEICASEEIEFSANRDS